MQVNDVRFGVVVATYSRPLELAKALTFISTQAVKPVAVVVVDSSPSEDALKTKEACSNSPENLSVTYLKSNTASSTVQRNEGIEELLKHNLDFIQVLDDDTMPSVDYCQRLIEVLLKYPSAVGASGVTVPTPPKPTFTQSVGRFIFVLFGLESYRGGSVSPAGCGIPVWRRSTSIQQVEWLFGCSMWRVNIFEKLRFNNRLVGAALAEDLHFSILASREGKLFVDPKAHLGHSYSPIERPDQAKFAYRFARNRWYVVRDMRFPIIAIPMYVISNAFLGFISLLAAIRKPSSMGFKASSNYIKGMVDAWRDVPPI